MELLTIPNEELYNELKRLEAENYHLKNQLKRKNKIIKSNSITIRELLKKLKDSKSEKQHYKNGRRGTFKNGG